MAKYSKTTIADIVVHYFKEEGNGLITHITHITNKSGNMKFIDKKTNEETIPRDRWLINSVDEVGNDEITREEFDLALKTAIFELGIYENTINNK